MNMKLDFVKEKTSRCFWLMFLPVMAAMFLNMAYNVVDSLWIGNLLGENAYAALTSSAPVVLILNSAAMGAANGVAIVAARALGTGCKEMAESVISTSFFMALAFSVSVTGITELLIPVILKALNTPLETLVMSTQYLSIYVLGYVCVFLYCYFTAVLRSFGNSVFQMTAMLVCTALNGVLDPVFIHFMGFKGAAVATVISQGLCLVFMIVYMFRKKYFCLRIKMCKKMYVKEIILKALPSAFQQSIPAVSTSFLTALVSSYGVTAIAAYGITGKLEILLFYPAMALNMVLSSMVGQCGQIRQSVRLSKIFVKIRHYNNAYIICGCRRLCRAAFGPVCEKRSSGGYCEAVFSYCKYWLRFEYYNKLLPWHIKWVWEAIKKFAAYGIVLYHCKDASGMADGRSRHRA